MCCFLYRRFEFRDRYLLICFFLPFCLIVVLHFLNEKLIKVRNCMFLELYLTLKLRDIYIGKLKEA